MSDAEERLAELERRVSRLEPHVERTMPLGPSQKIDGEIVEQHAKVFKRLMRGIKQENISQVDRSAQQLADGEPVPADQNHTELKTNGQQKGYVVLKAEERSKGFVRPVRHSYLHVGPLASQHALRDLTDQEKARYSDFGYAKFETYPPSDSSVIGKFWTQKDLDDIGTGCGTLTTMGAALAETYARDPKFYSGTFCCGCGKHFPVSEFVWDGTNERVGS